MFKRLMLVLSLVMVWNVCMLERAYADEDGSEETDFDSQSGDLGEGGSLEESAKSHSKEALRGILHDSIDRNFGN